MLKELHTIVDPESFQRWRSSFLESFEAMLDTDGIEKAREADSVVLKKLPTLDRTINNVRSCVRNGHISLDKKMGVKGQTAVNKLKEGCIDMEKRLQVLVPGSSAEAEAVGYNKFQLGAVLVKDGFKIYVYLVRQEAILKELKVSVLERVGVDRQIIDSLSYYLRQIQSLCDVMADLELFDVMIKTRELAGDKLFASRTKSIRDEKRELTPPAGKNKDKDSATSPSTVVDLIPPIDHAIDDDVVAKLPILSTPQQEDPSKTPSEAATTSTTKQAKPDCAQKTQPKVEPMAREPLKSNLVHKIESDKNTGPTAPPPKDGPASAAAPPKSNKNQPCPLEEAERLAERQRRVLSEQQKLSHLEQSVSETQRKLASEVAKKDEEDAKKAIMAKRAKKKSKKTPKPQEAAAKASTPEKKQLQVAVAAKAKEDRDKQVAVDKAKEERQKQAAAKAKEVQQEQAAAKAKDEQQKQATAAATKAKEEQQQEEATKAKEEERRQAAAMKAKEEQSKQAAIKAKEEQQKQAAINAKEEQQKQAEAAAKATERAKPKPVAKTPQTKSDEAKPKPAVKPAKPLEEEDKPKSAAKAEPSNNGKGDGDDNDFLIFFDPKTQAMGKLDKRRCIELGIITMSSQGGTESIEENLEDEAKLPLMRMIAKSMKRVLGNRK